MEKTDNRRLQKAILEVVDNQLRDNDPPETRQTLERLERQGYSEKEARKLIGFVVASEVFGVIRENRKYDREKFISALNDLPSLPWEEEH